MGLGTATEGSKIHPGPSQVGRVGAGCSLGRNSTVRRCGRGNAAELCRRRAVASGRVPASPAGEQGPCLRPPERSFGQERAGTYLGSAGLMGAEVGLPGSGLLGGGGLGERGAQNVDERAVGTRLPPEDGTGGRVTRTEVAGRASRLRPGRKARNAAAEAGRKLGRKFRAEKSFRRAGWFAVPGTGPRRSTDATM